jgi:hypothetical protein
LTLTSTVVFVEEKASFVCIFGFLLCLSLGSIGAAPHIRAPLEQVGLRLVIGNAILGRHSVETASQIVVGPIHLKMWILELVWRNSLRPVPHQLKVGGLLVAAEFGRFGGRLRVGGVKVGEGRGRLHGLLLNFAYLIGGWVKWLCIGLELAGRELTVLHLSSDVLAFKLRSIEYRLSLLSVFLVCVVLFERYRRI